MTVPDNLTFRRTRRVRLHDGRERPPADELCWITAAAKRHEHSLSAGYRLGPNGRDYVARGPRIALITRCDLRHVFLLNLHDREYVGWPLQADPALRAQTGQNSVSLQPPERREPTVLVETETVDTGERRTMFDLPARHVLTTRRIVPLAESRRRPQMTAIDGWYIDLEARVSCDDPAWRRGVHHAFLNAHKAGEEPERPTFHDIGEPERGFCVVATTTSIDQFGDSATAYRDTTEEEVTQLSMAPIAAATFEVPHGFREVDRIRQAPVPPPIVRWVMWYRRIVGRRR